MYRQRRYNGTPHDTMYRACHQLGPHLTHGPQTQTLKSYL
jgi:hypothetical protein